MAIETINLSQGIEQFFKVLYGKRNIRFDLRFNDFQYYWYIDVTDDDTGEEILMGKALLVDNDAFASRAYLGLGSLYLLDTTPESTTELDVKTDLGDRLILVRDYE